MRTNRAPKWLKAQTDFVARKISENRAKRTGGDNK